MTTTPKIYKTEAIVLKHFALGETDYLVTLYAPYMGKLKAVAKGARRVKSKLGGHLEPLMQASFLINKGQNLDTISQAEVLDGFRTVREDLERLSKALYMVELVDSITPDEQPNYPMYRLLLEALRSLSDDSSLLLLPFFQLRLLDHAGFMPELYQCVECSSIISPDMHYFTPDGGGTICVSCHPKNLTVLPLSLNSLKVLRFLQKEEYAKVEGLHIKATTASELSRLLGTLLEFTLGREVKATRFLNQVAGISVREGVSTSTKT